MKYIKDKAVICIIFALMILISIKYCNDKNGYYLDEIYSYGLANSEYAPWITDIKGGDITNQIITRQEFADFLMVNESDRFNYGSVYYNQTKDVHPPLYYFLIHTISSIFTDVFTDWIGLGLNLVLFITTLLLLYHLVSRFFCNQWNAILVTAIYGLSNIGLSTMMFIRMYMLLTFFTLVLAYLILSHMENGKKSIYLMIAITVFLGMITQYYFVIYAFFACAAYDIYLLLKKEYKTFVGFSVSALSGVLVMVVFFPHFVTQLSLQETVSMDKTVRNAKNITNWIPRIFEMNLEVAEDIKVALVFVGLLAISSLVAFLKKRSNAKKYCHTLIVIIPAFVAYTIICIIAPYVTVRYVYQLIPVLLLVICYLFSVQETLIGKKIIHYGIIGIAALLSVYYLRDTQPDYVYDHSEFSEVIAENSDSPCVFVTENAAPSITCAIPQLLYFDEIFVVEEAKVEQVNDYLAEYSECENAVVFFATVPQRADIDHVLNVLQIQGYGEYCHIYENEFISSYIVHH